MARRRDDYYYEDDRRYNNRRSTRRNSRYDGDRSNYRRGSNTNYSRRRKSEREARIERITWLLLVAVFFILYFVPNAFPNWAVPGIAAVVLFGSGAYQYAERYRVSPITWIAGAVMALFAYYSYQTGANMTGGTFIAVIAVILLGVLTGET